MSMMPHRNWTLSWRVAGLSALGGFCSSAFYLFAYRIDEYLEKLQYEKELAQEVLNPSGIIVSRFDMLNPLWWLNVSIWNIILFLICGLLAHRLLSRRIESVFLLWQIIGAAVILAWGLTVLIVLIQDGYVNQGSFPVERVLERFVFASYQLRAFKFVSVMVAGNVIYGTLLRLASRQYSRI